MRAKRVHFSRECSDGVKVRVKQALLPYRALFYIRVQRKCESSNEARFFFYELAGPGRRPGFLLVYIYIYEIYKLTF